MHNRLRMVVAFFLAKNLLLVWRTRARLVHPTTQGEHYNPEVEFVGAYVPELGDAVPDEIHGWQQLIDAKRGRVHRS